MESVHLIGISIAPIYVIANTSMLQAIYAIMSVSLKKHHVKGTVKIRKYIVMENARRGLCNVTVNVWMNDISLQIVMETAHIIKKVWCVMGNARRGLYSVMVNVWMNFLSLQIVMETAHIIKKVWCVMGNARRGLYSVMVNVWMNDISLQIVMEPAQIMNLKVGFAILYVSLGKNLATENALKVNFKLDKHKLDNWLF
jgi:hypothetical protein